MTLLKTNNLRLSAFKLGILLFIFLVAGSCSTKKNTWINRNYHSINAFFNGYFNARHLYNDGLNRLAKGHVENYDKVLHIFKYGDKQQMKSVSGSMDMVYEKCSRVIRKHSMLIRGTEHNKRIPSAYLLMAKSHFFQQNHPLSVIALQYIVREYQTDDAHEARVWIAKNYVFANNFDQAAVAINEIKRDIEDDKLNRNNRQLFNLVNADLQLRQEKYSEAIPFLQEAIKETRNSREKTRLTYILGQVYEEIGDYGNAQQTFAQVLKMRPTFELEFQARISMATAFDPVTGSSQAVYAELNKMLNQKRNQAFKDRIYYAMAQMALRQNDETQAIDLFKKSIESSVDNRMQKGLSFLKLGQLYFNRPDYLNSSISYDSTVVFLPGNFDNLQYIRTRQVILSELAKNIRVVQREDSLQRLAAMPANERNQIVDGIIAEYREEQRRLELERQDLGTSAYRTPQMRTDFAGETGWYFYNRNTMVAGSTEFRRRFGNRQLEDLWRIANRQMAAIGTGFDDLGEDEEGREAGDGRIDRSSLMQNIPLTPEKLGESNTKISQALFNKGMIYVERINDKTSAIRVFESLVNRFPDNQNVLHSYYYLINLLEDSGQASQAASYRTRLLNQYPESDFARVLKDPNFRQTLVQQKNAADLLYEETFNAFKSSNYQRVLDNFAQTENLDVRSGLKAQFKYLKALTHGRQNQEDLFKKELTEIVQNYSGSIVHQPAQILLASLGMPVLALDKPATTTTDEPGRIDDATGRVDEPSEPVIYNVTEDGLHFFVAIVDVNRVDLTEFTDYIKQFNDLNYRDRRLIVTNVFFDENRQIVTVSSFDNKTRGMQYFRNIESSPEIRNFTSDAFAQFIVSVDNYAIFYQNKSVSNYLRFFNENY